MLIEECLGVLTGTSVNQVTFQLMSVLKRFYIEHPLSGLFTISTYMGSIQP